MIWFRHCVCMVNQQQHYRRRACDCFHYCYSATTVCMRAFYWHTHTHVSTRLRHFSNHHLFCGLFLLLLQFICRICSFIGHTFALTHTQMLIYINTLPGYLLLLDLVLSSLSFLPFTFILSNTIYSLYVYACFIDNFYLYEYVRSKWIFVLI